MIILGSKSPRRKEILDLFKVEYKVCIIDVDEDIIENDPLEYSKKTALKKGLATSLKNPDNISLCADTIVTIDNIILGKPKDKADAINMLNLLSGRMHKVITSVYLGNHNNYKLFSDETNVYIRKLSPKEIIDYVSTSEPYDKAGAYAIQGIFNKYIEKIEGDYYNVMGLPIKKVLKELDNINSNI